MASPRLPVLGCDWLQQFRMSTSLGVADLALSDAQALPPCLRLFRRLTADVAQPSVNYCSIDYKYGNFQHSGGSRVVNRHVTGNWCTCQMCTSSPLSSQGRGGGAAIMSAIQQRTQHYSCTPITLIRSCLLGGTLCVCTAEVEEAEGGYITCVSGSQKWQVPTSIPPAAVSVCVFSDTVGISPGPSALDWWQTEEVSR